MVGVKEVSTPTLYWGPLSKREGGGSKPKTVLRGDSDLSATDRSESGLKPDLGCAAVGGGGRRGGGASCVGSAFYSTVTPDRPMLYSTIAPVAPRSP